MSNSTSQTTKQRFAHFSRTTWILGGIVTVIIAITSINSLGWDPDRGFVDLRGNSGGAGNYPWDQAGIQLLEPDQDGTTWRGTGDAVIHFDDYTVNDPHLIVTLVEGDGRMSLHYTEAGLPEAGLAPDERSWPVAADSLRLDESAFVPPVDGTVEIWVDGDGDWALTIAPGESEEIEDFAAGTGDAWLTYRGEALSGRFIHRGEGVFFVTLFTASGRDSLIIDSGEIDQRASWDPSPWVFIKIESDDGRGAWSIDLDDISGSSADPSADPDPAPEPSPSIEGQE